MLGSGNRPQIPGKCILAFTSATIYTFLHVQCLLYHKSKRFFQFKYHQYPLFGVCLHETHDDADKFSLQLTFSIFLVHNIKYWFLIMLLIPTHSPQNQLSYKTAVIIKLHYANEINADHNCHHFHFHLLLYVFFLSFPPLPLLLLLLLLLLNLLLLAVGNCNFSAFSFSDPQCRWWVPSRTRLAVIDGVN